MSRGKIEKQLDRCPSTILFTNNIITNGTAKRVSGPSDTKDTILSDCVVASGLQVGPYALPTVSLPTHVECA